MRQTPELIRMDRELIGTTLAGRYEVQTLLARGGMGRLYLALQQPLGRTVVIKVMTLPQILNTDAAALHARFFREAATCARLQHPNTVTLFDYGELRLDDGKTFYMVMEHLQGHNLSEVLRAEGRMQPVRALQIGAEVCRSLREAHALGVVHRDLKPSNVMLLPDTEGERVKVLDFGIAKIIAGDDTEPTEPTDSAEELTKLAMHGLIDARSDIYSLGAMLFHLISGRRPFRAHSATMRMLAHIHHPTPSIRAVTGEDIPLVVDTILQRCMAKDPDERYADADAMLAALRAALQELGAEPESSSSHASLPAVDEMTLSPVASNTVTATRTLAQVMPLALVFLLLAGIPTLALLGGGALWLLRRQQVEPHTVTAIEPVLAPVPVPVPATVEVVLRSEPPGATVYEGEETLGVTPLTLTLPADRTDTRRFQLKAAGFDPTDLSLDPDTTSPPTISLTTIVPEPPPVPISRPPRPRDDIIMER
ncbi:MAG: serine/threonine protein kinase [Myxococcota bacterium]|jgi:serine/threonine protein kinase